MADVIPLKRTRAPYRAPVEDLPLLFMDIETTGKHPPIHAIWELAIINSNDEVVEHTLINPGPGQNTPWQYHGVDDGAVTQAPSMSDYEARLEAIVHGHHVVMFNAARDLRFLPDGLRSASHVSCAMERFAPFYKQWDQYHGNYRWQSLQTAADFVGHNWTGPRHRALSDAQACRAVWLWTERQSVPIPLPLPQELPSPLPAAVNLDSDLPF